MKTKPHIKTSTALIATLLCLGVANHTYSAPLVACRLITASQLFDGVNFRKPIWQF